MDGKSVLCIYGKNVRVGVLIYRDICICRVGLWVGECVCACVLYVKNGIYQVFSLCGRSGAPTYRAYQSNSCAAARARLARKSRCIVMYIYTGAGGRAGGMYGMYVLYATARAR